MGPLVFAACALVKMDFGKLFIEIYLLLRFLFPGGLLFFSTNLDDLSEPLIAPLLIISSKSAQSDKF